MILSKKQRIGGIILFSLGFLGWMIAVLWPREEDMPKPSPTEAKKTWEERKDSIRKADSMRYVQWAAEREQRYDSFRVADSLRRAEWKVIRQAQYDSFRLADSLWRDSVGWRYAKRSKKDTILDLNHCDTAELQLLRGIGGYSARMIIDYRHALGGYYSTSQLGDPFFSKFHLDTLEDHFTVDTTAIRPIHVNNASIDAMQRHPYLRYKQAKAIYTLRRTKVKLRSINDLRALPEMADEDLKRLSPYLSFE